MTAGGGERDHACDAQSTVGLLVQIKNHKHKYL